MEIATEPLRSSLPRSHSNHSSISTSTTLLPDDNDSFIASDDDEERLVTKEVDDETQRIDIAVRALGDLAYASHNAASPTPSASSRGLTTLLYPKDLYASSRDYLVSSSRDLLDRGKQTLTQNVLVSSTQNLYSSTQNLYSTSTQTLYDRGQDLYGERVKGIYDKGVDIYDGAKANSRVVRIGAGIVERALGAGESGTKRRATEDPESSPPSNAGSPAYDPSSSPIYDPSSPVSPPLSPSPGPEDDQPTVKRRKTVSKSNGASTKHTKQKSGGKHSRQSSRGNNPRVVQPPPPEMPTPPSSGHRWPTIRSTATRLTGLGAALTMSEDGMRRLRFCLGCLMHATQHIDKQILLIRDFTQGLQDQLAKAGDTTPRAERGPREEDEEATPAQLATLAALRSEIVNTVRQVVDVVGKYSGPPPSGAIAPEAGKDDVNGAAPQEGLDATARARVKNFILSMPGRWKERVRATPSTSPTTSTSTSPTSSSPSAQLMDPSATGSLSASGPPPTLTTTLQTAHRVLALATESLDMVRGVTGVVKESLERAEGWVGWMGGEQQRDSTVDAQTHDGPQADHDSPSANMERLSMDEHQHQKPLDAKMQMQVDHRSDL